jgi:hypothetical protein
MPPGHETEAHRGHVFGGQRGHFHRSDYNRPVLLPAPTYLNVSAHHRAREASGGPDSLGPHVPEDEVTWLGHPSTSYLNSKSPSARRWIEAN